MKITTKLDIIGQKIKGKTQRVKGGIEIASGHPIKGRVDKIRGKINEASADIKDKMN